MKSQHFHKTSLVSIILLLFLLPGTTLAQLSSLIFERTDIRIMAALPANDQAVTASHAPITLNVELRPEDSLRLEYIHALNTLTPNSGVMIALTAPAMVPLPAMKVYTPVDIIFIGDDGTIIQISPNVVLGEMTQIVKAKKPIKALLFLKAGLTATHFIQPRDRVIGKMFSPEPALQE